MSFGGGDAKILAGRIGVATAFASRVGECPQPGIGQILFQVLSVNMAKHMAKHEVRGQGHGKAG
jgi:hypothetical protein